jgi:hypothetical protein
MCRAFVGASSEGFAPVVINGLDYYDMFKSRIIWRKVPPKHRALIECHVLAR